MLQAHKADAVLRYSIGNKREPSAFLKTCSATSFLWRSSPRLSTRGLCGTTGLLFRMRATADRPRVSCYSTKLCDTAKLGGSGSTCENTIMIADSPDRSRLRNRVLLRASRFHTREDTSVSRSVKDRPRRRKLRCSFIHSKIENLGAAREADLQATRLSRSMRIKCPVDIIRMHHNTRQK